MPQPASLLEQIDAIIASAPAKGPATVVSRDWLEGVRQRIRIGDAAIASVGARIDTRLAAIA